MKKSIILLLCALLLFCAGCGEISVPAPSVETNEPVEEPPIFLELHFGNGEVLRKEIGYLLVPTSSGGVDSSFSISRNSCFGEVTWFQTPMWIYFTNERASYTAAVFPDGNKYSMSGIKSTEVDIESRTLIAYLWRDEPYQTELEYFDTVLESETSNE